MELVGEYPVYCDEVYSEDKVRNKLVYKRDVRVRTVGNMTVPETRYYTSNYYRLEKIQEDVFVSGEYQTTVEYFRYKGA